MIEINDKNVELIVIKALNTQIESYKEHIKICNSLRDDELVAEAEDKILEVKNVIALLTNENHS